MVRICVLGAGVIGLTTANFLKEAMPGASVTIVADKFLQDTVSDVAAGIFRLGRSFQGPTPEISRKWLTDSYNYFRKILESDEANAAGVKLVSGYVMSRRHKNVVESPLMESIVHKYRPCSAEELKSLKVKYGYFLTTTLTECRRYLPYLTSKFLKQGGKILERHIDSLEHLADEYDLVCNCTGLRAQYLCDDDKITSCRGQVFKVRAPWINHVYMLDEEMYIVPGFDTITVGGTRQLSSYDDKVNKHDAANIWERAVEFVPSLKDAEIVTERVGFRPHRSCIRIEKELMKFDSGKTLKVVHHYGHGGRGVMTSPGTSMHAVTLVKEMLENKSKL